MDGETNQGGDLWTFFFFQRSVLARAHEISKYTAFMLENSGKYLLKTYCSLHQALL